MLAMPLQNFVSVSRARIAPLIASAVLLWALAPHSATASPALTLSRTVKVGDLDLSSADGISTAESRVRRTARLLCHRLGDGQRVDAEILYAQCTREAYEQAWRTLLARISTADSPADVRAESK